MKYVLLHRTGAAYALASCGGKQQYEPSFARVLVKQVFKVGEADMFRIEVIILA